ncbi:LSU ribosomal protein L21p [Mycoplasmopsis meleagridis]|uniref:Large ribosomal subunit protein bL21 n=1 Tax=Mycoplasmopsis meleagridis ATCC 25294 TaxID=1264554 RepID=A0A0F5GZW4_9BACT|nr:50S ribosomal protein L21 [Mycoplasmopsis meleagridis]KKB26601.1 LSU ribosomal protein L21p [Mycoplasmopsis meleagridis ATCC 25294]KUH47426.1 50S ribosomal protein L21 [Mycoplasmopsis meleagridis]OAD18471.1 LSU ribosomal protein L21p [Mycoplasmopsis meleagridis]VEU77660.1 50S ribosomal protein L21 [Mycoplasmopsis meleagridis]
MTAIIETGGKQILIKNEGQTIFIEKIEGKEGDLVTFDKVLLINNKIGRPYVTNAKVTGIIKKQGKAKKIVVYRHNPKSTHKRKLGHRQPYTRVEIKEILG